MALTNQQKLDATHYKVDRYLDTKTSHVADQVWSTPIHRDGKQISALQELADAKTLGLKNEAALVEVNRKLDQIIAKLNEGA